MIDKAVIEVKLESLGLYVKELTQLSIIPYAEYSSSLSKQWQVCHGLQLAVQAVIDTGNHILAAHECE